MARAKRLSDAEQAALYKAAELTRQEHDLAARQRAHAAEMADQELQLRLLCRHADHREPLIANSGEVAKTVDEGRVAASA